MNNRTIVTVIAATLLSMGVVPVGSALDINAGIPEGIEVITVYAKRPVPTISTTCVNAVIAGTDTATERHYGESNLSNEDSGRPNSNSARRAIKRCIEQSATPLEAQI